MKMAHHLIVSHDGHHEYARDVFTYLAKAAGFQYSFVHNSESEFGQRNNDTNNGNWSGILGSIQRGNVDTFLCFWGITAERAQDFDITYPVVSSKLIMRTTDMMSSEDPINLAIRIVSVYSFEVWLLIVAGALLMSGVKHIAAYKMEINCEVLQFIFGLMIEQIPKIIADMAIVIFGGVYKVAIYRALMQPSHSYIFPNDVDVLRGLQNNELSMYIYGDDTSFRYRTLYDATSSLGEAYKLALINNRIQFSLRLDDLKKLTTNRVDRTVLLQDVVTVDNYGAICGSHWFTTNLDTTAARWSFVFQKGSPLTQRFNNAIVKHYEQIHYIQKRRIKNEQRRERVECGDKSQFDGKQQHQPLKLATFMGALCFYIALNSVAIGVAVVELFTECGGVIGRVA